MKILGRLFWVIAAIILGVYAVVVGGAYLVLSPFIWLVWWVISGKSFAIGNILFTIFAPTLLVFDHLEKISNI